MGAFPRSLHGDEQPMITRWEEISARLFNIIWWFLNPKRGISANLKG
jgi:hypothetical protein